MYHKAIIISKYCIEMAKFLINFKLNYIMTDQAHVLLFVLETAILNWLKYCNNDLI